MEFILIHLNSFNGCDSIVYTQIFLNNNYLSNNVLSVCYGDTVLMLEEIVIILLEIIQIHYFHKWM